MQEGFEHLADNTYKELESDRTNQVTVIIKNIKNTESLANQQRNKSQENTKLNTIFTIDLSKHCTIIHVIIKCNNTIVTHCEST